MIQGIITFIFGINSGKDKVALSNASFEIYMADKVTTTITWKEDI